MYAAIIVNMIKKVYRLINYILKILQLAKLYRSKKFIQKSIYLILKRLIF